MANRGVIFDFNGTLFFDTVHHVNALSAMYSKYGKVSATKEEIIEKAFGRTNFDIVRTMYKEDATLKDVEEFTDIKENLYRESVKLAGENALCKGADKALSYLKENNIPYCIATGSEITNVKFYFDYLGIGKWFSMDNIIYTDGSFPGKPCPDIFILAAKRLSLEPSECIVFEDGIWGINAAIAAGVTSIVALYEKNLKSPVDTSSKVLMEIHDLSNYKEIFACLGL